MEECLPFINIEVFVEDGEINFESIRITNIIHGAFPLNHIQLLKYSMIDQFDCSNLPDDWYQMQLKYVRDGEFKDHYEMIPYPFSKLLYKQLFDD